MRILDRYILATFLKNYLLSFMVLIGLYVVLDMVINVDELARIQPSAHASGIAAVFAIIWDIGDYYFFQIFPIYALLSGIIAVVAAAFTMMRLSRFNELVAILAAGVPLLRVVMPIIIAGAVLSGGVIIDNELIIPNIIPQLQRDRKEAGRIINKTFPVWSMRDDQGRLLTAALFRSGPGNPSMDKISIISTDDHFQPTSLLVADKATWNPDARLWELSPDAKLTTGLLPNEQLHTDNSVHSYESNITPVEISLYRSREFVRFLSTNKIDELLQQKQSYGLVDLLKVKHSRFTQPIMNIILLLLAIPTVLTREPGKLKSGAIKCVLLTGAAMGTAFITSQLNPPLDSAWALQWPAILAWLPIFIFGPLSIYLLDRVKS